jgi:hypothetical protein
VSPLRLRGRSGSLTRRIKPRYEWEAAVIPLTSVPVNSTSTTAIVSQPVMDEIQKPTILRIRGQVTVNPATSPAAATGYEVFMGIHVRDIQAAISWDPELQMEFGWMWHKVIAPQMGGTGASDSNIMRFAAYFRMEIDVRAKRKVGENYELDFVIKNSNSSGASVQYFASFRILLLAGH